MRRTLGMCSTDSEDIDWFQHTSCLRGLGLFCCRNYTALLDSLNFRTSKSERGLISARFEMIFTEYCDIYIYTRLVERKEKVQTGTAARIFGLLLALKFKVGT